MSGSLELLVVSHLAEFAFGMAWCRRGSASGSYWSAIAAIGVHWISIWLVSTRRRRSSLPWGSENYRHCQSLSNPYLLSCSWPFFACQISWTPLPADLDHSGLPLSLVEDLALPVIRHWLPMRPCRSAFWILNLSLIDYIRLRWGHRLSYLVLVFRHW